MEAEEQINILIVDDNPTNLLTLETILRAPDRNLVRAASGDDALRYLLDNEVAVILMDIFMPGIDGLDTAALIRSRDKSRDIPIIFLTADTAGRHLSRGYSLGAVDYIVKPIMPDILRSKVAVFVQLFRKTREVKRQAQLLEEKNLQLENANLARLNMLIDLGHELAAEHKPERVLENFCRSARRIVGAQEAAVGVMNADDKTLRHFFHCSDSGDTVIASPNKIPKLVQRVLNTLTTSGRPLRVNNDDALLLGNNASSYPVNSFLGAPILSGSKVIGWVYMLNKLDAVDFSEADESLAATLATQVAVAYENATLYTEAESHAAELQLEITERKQAEAERAKLLILEQSARAEAEQANRTKDEFLAILSHELRTPLTAILGWSHLVRTRRLDELELLRAVETIERNARSQSQLIDDLLDVSRIITGKLQIEPRSVDLCSVIEATIEAGRPSFCAKAIQVEQFMDPVECFVFGDANRLQQIFWNLLNNAVKFTPEGGTVRVERRHENGCVRISVSDSGIGISAEVLPYIFDRFRQGDGSTTRVYGGLGLGLSIVKHLVQLHNGSIEVESLGLNQGATFIVSLPLGAAEPCDSATPIAAELGGNGLAADLRGALNGLRILVVDDDLDARDLMNTILSEYGSEVKCCKSVAEALDAFKQWSPDLLVSDIGMPNEDGYTLIKKLRKSKSKRAREIPAIAITAYATKEDKARTLAAGFQVHVAKPIETETFLRLIATTVGLNIS